MKFNIYQYRGNFGYDMTAESGWFDVWIHYKAWRNVWWNLRDWRNWRPGDHRIFKLMRRTVVGTLNAVDGEDTEKLLKLANNPELAEHADLYRADAEENRLLFSQAKSSPNGMLIQAVKRITDGAEWIDWDVTTAQPTINTVEAEKMIRLILKTAFVSGELTIDPIDCKLKWDKPKDTVHGL